jgi:hypothetical protein
MAHLKHSGERAAATDVRWLRRGAEIAALANEWSGRGDLVAYVGPGAGGPAPACYAPHLSEIEVNVDVAFAPGIDPDLVGDLRERANQYTWAKGIGAIKHEAFHAKHSHWSMLDANAALKSDEYGALLLLEEGRIEARGVAADPSSRVFLRACAMEIVLADAREAFASLTNIRAAAQIVGLLHARVLIGIIDESEVDAIMEKVEDILGLDLVDALLDLITKAQAHTNDYNIEALYPVAQEWARLVSEASEEAGEPQQGQPGEGGEGAPDGSGEASEGGEGGLSEIMQDILEAMEEAAESVAINNNDDLADQEETEAWKQVVEARASSAREQKDNAHTAAKVFGRPKEGGTKSASRLYQRRAPRPNERIAAVTVAQQLERAKYRERDITEVRDIVPPGRLRTRAMVQAAAQKAQGRMVQAEAWKRKVRKNTDEPTLTIGVMVDISGSMGSAMEPMATTAYVMSEAGRRVQARSAMVYYGNTVFPTLKPGEHLSEVQVYTAPDGTEKFDEAFRALDGSLNLLHGTGARLLVICSDGAYTYEETEAARRWMKRCETEGVAVLWLPFDHGRHADEILKGIGTANVVRGELDPAAAAMQIGKAAANAMTKIGQRVG